MDNELKELFEIEADETQTINSVEGLENVTADLMPGDTYKGEPEIVIMDKTSKAGNEYSTLRFTLKNELLGEYVAFYYNCSKPDSEGVVRNIGTAGFTYPMLKLLNSFYMNVVGSQYPTSFIKKINLARVVEYLNDLESITLEVVEGKNLDDKPFGVFSESEE